MLKKLYMKGSLTNNDDGFEFALKNTLMDATIVSPITLHVDNKPIPPETVTITAEQTSWQADEISESSPAPLKVDVQVTLTVKGTHLTPGEHAVEIAATTKEYGDIVFTVTDTL
jgi:hypothetical protein